MLDYLLSFVIDVLHMFYTKPFIKRITKTTIMGTPVNMTINYYLDNFISSPLDVYYTIDYLYNNKEYTLVTKNDMFKDAIKYIKSFKYVFPRNNILVAIEKEIDITVLI